MSARSQKFVLDANVFIQAKRRYYSFDICPGYWRALKWHQEMGGLYSIDRVYDELKRGDDDLSNWIETELREEFFAETSDSAVVASYTRILAWVMAQSQFLDAAKSKFQDVADGWLAAFAHSNDYVVVTLEEYDPVIRKNVPLPNVCRAFDVEWINPYEMLRRLNVKLSWQPPS